MLIDQEIHSIKEQLGSDLLIVAHHYQNSAVIKHAHLRGDSLELARNAMQSEAQHIVFCGVHFMAESAALLAQNGQKVYMPTLEANCAMAQMSPAFLIDLILKKLCAKGRKIIPLAYINTSLAVKAVVGRYNGSVCTSANADKMLAWALKQGDAVLFLPDKNLARNTAHKLNLAKEAIQILDVSKNGANIDLEEASKATLLCYPGLCAIHSKFKASQIQAIRQKDSQAKVIVHPECPPEVVQAADLSGSTSSLINYVEKADAKHAIYIGTEINLVQRLAEESGKKVYPLHYSACSDMAKVTPENLLQILREIKNNKASQVQIDFQDIAPAKLALETMLKV